MMISNNPIVDLRKIKNERERQQSDAAKLLIGAETADKQEDETENLISDVLKEWEAPEFVPHEGGKHVKAAGIILAALIVAVAVVTRNVLLGIFIILASLILYAYSRKAPRTVSVKITKMGVWLDLQFYPFDHLKSFWVFFEPEFDLKEISFISKKMLIRPLRVSLADQKPQEIRAILLHYLPEEKQEETFTEFLIRTFGL